VREGADNQGSMYFVSLGRMESVSTSEEVAAAGAFNSKNKKVWVPLLTVSVRDRIQEKSGEADYGMGLEIQAQSLSMAKTFVQVP